MRLTLRTLLAYLDDTLDPTQAKIIGQKVAESDQARELMEHIKQVTRRRRITTPPANGHGGKIDPNTIAEYLDSAVSAEQASEVEQICLASDVHLAEVAADHQILALVLGEPALVPPTAKTRMYGLVKGPESIPFRKPTNPSVSDHEEAPDSDDVDDTLRMGLPPIGGGRGNGCRTCCSSARDSPRPWSWVGPSSICSISPAAASAQEPQRSAGPQAHNNDKHGDQVPDPKENKPPQRTKSSREGGQGPADESGYCSSQSQSQ